VSLFCLAKGYTRCYQKTEIQSTVYIIIMEAPLRNTYLNRDANAFLAMAKQIGYDNYGALGALFLLFKQDINDVYEICFGDGDNDDSNEEFVDEFASQNTQAFLRSVISTLNQDMGYNPLYRNLTKLEHRYSSIVRYRG